MFGELTSRPWENKLFYPLYLNNKVLNLNLDIHKSELIKYIIYLLSDIKLFLGVSLCRKCYLIQFGTLSFNCQERGPETDILK